MREPTVHNFNEDAFDSLYPKCAGGRPPTFTLPQRQEIKKMAQSRPRDHGLHHGRKSWREYINP
jgi:transposase